MKLTILLAAVLPLAAAPLQFHSAAWTVTLDPADLSVSAVLPGGHGVVISAPQAGLGGVTELAHDAAGAHWSFPGSHISVTASLRDNAFSIQFATDLPGKFVWPVSPTPEDGVSYIIPKGEGFLVDPRDAVWLSKAWPREFDTMSDFSLPLWGVMGRGWTLTYLLSNAFDNVFSWRDAARARVAGRA